MANNERMLIPAEIGAVKNIRILPQLLGFAREANMSPLHDVDAMRDSQRDMRKLLDQQHADAICGKLNDHRNQPCDNHGSKAERQFIRKDIARSIDDGLGKYDHLLLTAGERSRPRVEFLAELGKRIERRLDAVLSLAARQMMTGDPKIIEDR